MKLILKTAKPRNPHACAASLRAAGRHRPTTGAARQTAQRAFHDSLRSEWDDWRKPT